MSGQLHVYGQEFWHSPAYIVGDAEALRELRDACDIALTGMPVAFRVRAGDGEGYLLSVVRHVDLLQCWVPYRDPVACGEPRETDWVPWRDPRVIEVIKEAPK